MKKLKKCIFFPLMGDYDDIKEPTYITPGWDYICFTNNSKLKSKNWDIRFISNNGLSNVKLSRNVWILNHEYVGEYDISISVGAQAQLVGDFNLFLESFLPTDKKIDMSMAKHPARICAYAESNKCIVKKLDDPDIIKRQMSFYKKEGFPKNSGLICGGGIIRKHNRPNLEKHCELWWDQVNKWSYRDQLSFNYILWKYNLVNINYYNIRLVKITKKNKSGYWKRFPHKK